MADWQPIETAPKNSAGELSGPMILVWCGYDGVVRQAYWTARGETFLRRMGWFTFDGSALVSKRPTHWMPLPEPPEQAA